MTNIYYDTEFLEDGHTIELISIGMVRDDGAEYYAINLDLPWTRILKHDWLMANVVPYLPTLITSDQFVKLSGKRIEPGILYPDLTNRLWKSQLTIRNEVRAFIGEVKSPQLWAWYGAYDHVVLAQLFGRMIEMPWDVPKWTNDLRQEVERLGNPRLPEQTLKEHHALADAKWVQSSYHWLAEYGRSVSAAG